jgi:hypothetical protein
VQVGSSSLKKYWILLKVCVENLNTLRHAFVFELSLLATFLNKTKENTIRLSKKIAPEGGLLCEVKWITFKAKKLILSGRYPAK